MQYGLIFKTDWGRKTLDVYKVRDTDTYKDGEEIKLLEVEGAWSKAAVKQERAIELYSLKTKRTRDGYVVSI